MRTLTGSIYANDASSELSCPVSLLLSDGHSAIKIGSEWFHIPAQCAYAIEALLRPGKMMPFPEASPAPSSPDPASNESAAPTQ